MKKNIFMTLLPALTMYGVLNAQQIPDHRIVARQFPSLENAVDTCIVKKLSKTQIQLRAYLLKQDSASQNTAQGTLFIAPDTNTTKRNKNANTNAIIDGK